MFKGKTEYTIGCLDHLLLSGTILSTETEKVALTKWSPKEHDRSLRGKKLNYATLDYQSIEYFSSFYQ